MPVHKHNSTRLVMAVQQLRFVGNSDLVEEFKDFGLAQVNKLEEFS